MSGTHCLTVLAKATHLARPAEHATITQELIEHLFAMNAANIAGVAGLIYVSRDKHHLVHIPSVQLPAVKQNLSPIS